MRLEDVEVVDESGTVIPVTDVRIENVAWPFADPRGTSYRLSQYLGKKDVVLVFFIEDT